jgi:nucleoside-diphosphate-sugar epimerase
MAKIAITGATGFVGRYVVPVLGAAGHEVTALVRSPASAQAAEALGASSVVCDLSDPAALATALEGAQSVVHMAARLDFSGAYPDFFADNVLLTERVLAASEAAGVPRFVHVGAAAVAIGAKAPSPLTETAEPCGRRAGHYGATKWLGEQRVMARNSDRFRCIVLRPPLVWAEDAPVFDTIAAAAAGRRFVWIDGGRYSVATIHAENLAAGIGAALTQDALAGVYFVSDGECLPFRELVGTALKARGMPVPGLSLPRWAASLSGWGMEMLWRVFRLQGSPPITPSLVDLIGGDFRIDDSKARRALGYRDRVSVAEGLARLRGEVRPHN